MAENPTDAHGTLVAEAVGEETLLAKLTVAAGFDARDDDVVTNRKGVNRAANLGDYADALMAKDAPRGNPGTSPLRMCRSVLQIVVVSIRTITSVECCILEFGTSCQAFWPGPLYTSAFMATLLVAAYGVGVRVYGVRRLLEFLL